MDIPAGVSFLTGQAAVARRRLEEWQASILAREGFEEVIPPVFEFWEGEEGDRVYRFPDQLSGRTLALRWDFTLQVARLAAFRLRREEGPLRLFYRGNVYRPVREHAGEKRQLYQLGGELIGDPSVVSTARVLDLAVELLAASGLEDFSVVVGHVGFVDGLTRSLGVAEEACPEIREILRRKDLSALERRGRALGLSPEGTAALRRAMYLLGGEEILDEAERLCSGMLPSSVMAELRGVAELARGARGRLLFDLTEPRGFDYYTGVMFQAVAPRIGQEVLRGGRYDNLLGRFGSPAPAVGFAVDLDLALEAAMAAGREGSDHEQR